MSSVEESRELFRKRWGSDPEWVIRCPGRVNLIGEHIDYSDYSVLPMAIHESTFIAIARSTEPKLVLENVDNKYTPFVYEIGDDFSGATNSSAPKWYHYFLAGWRGVLERLAEDGANSNGPLPRSAHGMHVLVNSRIPPSAGLSSSSALVCAAALCTLAVQTGQTFERFSKKELAEIATRAEKYVGTEGGGMDQACECLADRGSALRIDFRPLQWTPVRLPENALFAVVHSGREMNKAASAYYNQRVVECRIAAQIIAKQSGVLKSSDQWHSIRTLRQVAALLDCADAPEKMLPLVEKFLKKDANSSAHSRQKICQILNCTNEELAKHSLNANTQDMQEFWLTKRAEHVYSEAARVFEFERVCNRQEKSQDNENQKEALSELARLMTESHRSCAEKFECSCPELDATVAKCVSSGCLAARLTGAGWGGCVVTLVEKSERERVVANGLDAIFWSEPCPGIEAFKIGK